MAKGIYKRSNSAFYWIRYCGLDGQMVRESAKTTKFKEAESLLLQRKQAIREGKDPVVKKIKPYLFSELAQEYAKWAERQKSFESKIYIIKQLADTFGSLPLRSFTVMLLEKYQSEILQSGRKPATANRHHATLSHMLSKAVEWEMMGEDTLKSIRRVKLLPENNKRLRFLNREECQTLINSCDAHLRPIVITALNAGMRKGEILSLKLDNVDLKHGFILLDKTKNGERREIPINATLKHTLQGITRRLDVPYVFFDPNTGKPYQDVKRSFHTALRKAGIRDFHFHDTRHCFASLLIMNGVDLTTVSRLLGHKDIKMTLRYSHLAPAHMVKAVDVLDKALTGDVQHIYSTLSEIRRVV